MKLLSYTFTILLLLGFSSNSYSNSGEKDSNSTPKIQNVPGELIIKFKTDPHLQTGSRQTSFNLVNEQLELLQITEINYAFDYLRGSGKMGADQLSNICFVNYNPMIDAAQVISSLKNDPNIEYVEPKRVFPIDAEPNDPSHNSMAQFIRVNAEAAWDVVKGEDGNVVIAIVDSGVDWDHPDLLANIWNNEDEIPDNGIDDDENGFIDDIRGWSFQNDSNDPTPLLSGHGTHVAGTAAGVTNNSIGVSSLSWNCTIMPINSGSPTSSTGIATGYPGIVYAASNGADVINCSWGGTGNPSAFDQDVIDFAIANGALVVAAAGNDGINNDITKHYPGSYRGVLNTGSTQKTSDVKSGFSQYGRSVDVFIPGSSILSTTWPGNGYGNSSGTSMASPMAAAMAGLVKTQNPDWTPEQVREQIRVTCDNIDGVNGSFAGRMGRGRVNALRAVTEFGIPGLQITEIVAVEAPGGNGDDIIDAGETIDVSVTFKNYLADASGVNITLFVDDSNIDVIDDQGSLANLNSGESSTLDFQFSTDDGLEEGYLLRFYTDISADNDYEDMDHFTLSISPPHFVTHDTGPLQVSVTNTGNIGAAGFIGTAPGIGFIYNEDQYLFEGGLLVGISTNQISNCIRVAGADDADQDFSVAEGGALTIVEPGEEFDQESNVLYTDEVAANPLNIFIEQQGFTTLNADSNNYIILTYEVRNENASVLNNVHIGLFFDWDISATAADYGRHDASRRMGITQNTANDPDKIVAVKLLTNNGGYHHRTVHNPDEVYNDFSDAEKFQFISSGIQTESIDNIDVSNMTGVGPFSLEANESIIVAFVVIGANSIEQLETSADIVQALWDITNGLEEIGINLKLNLFPNPVEDHLTLEFMLEQSRNIGFRILNLNGQVLLTKEAKKFNVGAQSMNIDMSSLTTGTYLMQLEVDGQSVTKKIVVN